MPVVFLVRPSEGEKEMPWHGMNIIDDKSEKERWAVRKRWRRWWTKDLRRHFHLLFLSPSLFSIPVAVIFFFLLLLKQKQGPQIEPTQQGKDHKLKRRRREHKKNDHRHEVTAHSFFFLLMMMPKTKTRQEKKDSTIIFVVSPFSFFQASSPWDVMWEEGRTTAN